MKILVAVDSSGYAEDVLAEIAKRDWPGGTEFRLVTAIEKSTNWETEQDMSKSAEVLLNDRLHYLKKNIKNREIEGEVLVGAAPEMIVEYARDWHANLIVIGAHGLSGTHKSTVGSVAAAVVNTAPCSVEVVKAEPARVTG